MKIVCDVCQAKYSIADEKIQGKAFKIRCKKCNHVIVVRHTGEVATVPAAAGADRQRATGGAPAPAASDQGVWHVVVDGEQVGPVTEAEVREKLRLGQLGGESLVWKEGFADWAALSGVPELAALQPKRASAVRASVHELSVPSTGSPSADAGDVFAAATVVSQPSADVFAASAAPQAVPSPVAPAPSSPFLFGGAQASEPAVVIKNPGNGAGGTQLTGQRNENSVLFSLANLEALAVPSQSSPGIRVPSTTASTEGSGLIDIRSMAAMTLHEGGDARRSSEALPTFSTPQFSPVAPVLLPISNSGPPKWVYPVLGFLGIGILVLGYGIYHYVTAPPPGTPIIIQQAAPPPAPPPPAAAQAPGSAPAPAPEAAKPAAPEEKPAASASAEDKTPEKGKSSSSRSDRGRRRGDSSSRGEGKRGGESGVSFVESSGSRGKGKGKGKEIADVASEFGKKGSEEPPKPAPPQVKLVTLTQSDIVNAMKGVQPRVQACANQFKVPGTAMANISVASGGKVSSAKVTGKFAGTPTGTCVESAARSAKFPACQSMNFPWPFTLMPR
jgi:predicted Zn finger-like uncharacterized protein